MARPQRTSKFVPNPMLEQELKRSTMFTDDLLSIAADIMEKVQEIGPEDQGKYKEAMAVESGSDSDGVLARFIANDWKAALIEYGTAEHQFNAPIRTAIQQLGLDLEDSR